MLTLCRCEFLSVLFSDYHGVCCALVLHNAQRRGRGLGSCCLQTHIGLQISDSLFKSCRLFLK